MNQRIVDVHRPSSKGLLAWLWSMVRAKDRAEMLRVTTSPNQVLTHAARAAALPGVPPIGGKRREEP